MFNIGAGELLIVLIVAFVIVGPDDLPKVARWLARQIVKLKKLLREIKSETGIDEIEKEARSVQRDIKSTVRELDISADLKDAVKEIQTEATNVTTTLQKDMRELDADVKKEMKNMDAELRSSVKAATIDIDSQSPTDETEAGV